MNPPNGTPDGAPLLEPLEPRLLLDATLGEQALELFSASPALFVENQGQWADESVRYVHQGNGANVAMTDAGPVFQVFRQVPRAGADELLEDGLSDPLGSGRFDPADDTTEALTFSASFVGGAAVTPVGLEQSEAAFNYFLGDQAAWRSGVPAYEKVAYESLYDGIDLHVWGKRSHLKYEFRVEAGADWSAIEVRYDGVEGLALSEDGSLVVDLGEGWGQVVDDPPYIYQEVDGEQVEVAGRFVLLDDGSYGFEVTGDYDTTRALVIDPALSWSTYLGGSDYDDGYGIAVDASGNVLVTGYTRSSGWVSGGFDTSHNGCNGCIDAFVAKLSPSGGHLWSTYLGGISDDRGHGIAVDASGNALVTGYTQSSGWVSGGFDTSYGGNRDAFVAKLSPSGGHLWSTYLGGSIWDRGYGIAVDASGNALVTGETWSSGWVSGGFDTSYNGGECDAFVAKISPSGGHLWSTYLGGSSWDTGYAIAVDTSGNALVTGETYSSGWVSGGFDTSYNGGGDAFVAKLSSSGSHLWSTYLGGSLWDQGRGIAVDASGNVLVTGKTRSSGWVSGGFDTTYNGGDLDAFVAKLSLSGGHLWSTYLGGISDDYGRGIAVDASGNALVTGPTRSSGWVSRGFDTSHNGDFDTFVAKLSSSGSHLWSTYLGGSDSDCGFGIAVDASGNVLVTGYTRSSGWATAGAYDTSYNGGGDVFVAKIVAGFVDTTPPAVTGVELNSRPGRTVSSIEPSGVGVWTIDVTFSEAVTVDPAAVVVQTVAFPDAPVTIGRAIEQPAPDTVRITLGDPGSTVGVVDTWVKVTIDSAGIADAAGNALDGEPAANSSGLGYIYDAALDLPSGNGAAGGDAVFYVGSLRGDYRGSGFGNPPADGQVTVVDINSFTAAYNSGDLDADFRGSGFGSQPPDGQVTVVDINSFTAAYNSGNTLEPLPTEPPPMGMGAGMAVSGPEALPLASAEPAALTDSPEAALLAEEPAHAGETEAAATALPGETPPAAAAADDDFTAGALVASGAAAAPQSPAWSPAASETAASAKVADSFGESATDIDLAAGSSLLDPLALPALNVRL